MVVQKDVVGRKTYSLQGFAQLLCPCPNCSVYGLLLAPYLRLLLGSVPVSVCDRLKVVEEDVVD